MAAAPSYRIDESKFPLVRVEFLGAQSDGELEDLLRIYDDLMFTRKQRYGMVVEAQHSKMTPLHQLRRQAEWMKTRDAQIKKQVVGFAFVLGSPILRGVLKVALTIQPLPVAHVVCESRDEADRWIRARLERAQDRVLET